MDHIIGTVYAGCEWDAKHKSQNMNVILDLREEAKINDDVSYTDLAFFSLRRKQFYIHHPCMDGFAVSAEYLNYATKIIAEAERLNLNILVHCAAGVSRTATVICAYLVSYYGMDPDSAYKYARNKRPFFMPHPELWTSLGKFSEQFGHTRISEWNSMFGEDDLN